MSRRTKKPEQSQTLSPAKEYEPTPAEQAALDAFRERRKGSAPRVKLTGAKGEPKKLEVEHPEQNIGYALLMNGLATADLEFLNGLLTQLVNVGSLGKEADETGLNFLLSCIRGIAPRDPLETLLAAQMGTVHAAAMTFGRRLASVETLAQQDSAQRAFNSLTRTFAAQMAALKQYRSKGQQVVRVERVVVNEGGQAIVGPVSHQGAGPSEKGEEQPHAKQLEYAPGTALPGPLETDREALRLAGG
jgi:hypothetical protein